MPQLQGQGQVWRPGNQETEMHAQRLLQHGERGVGSYVSCAYEQPQVHAHTHIMIGYIIYLTEPPYFVFSVTEEYKLNA